MSKTEIKEIDPLPPESEIKEFDPLVDMVFTSEFSYRQSEGAIRIYPAGWAGALAQSVAIQAMNQGKAEPAQ